MKTYFAFLRGINVGGKSIIKMADLKVLFEKIGLKNVRTYIQSGNVIFETDKNVTKLEEEIEKEIFVIFKCTSLVIIKSHKELEKINTKVPREWRENKDIRCYIALVKAPHTPEEVIIEVKLREGVDFVSVGNGVVYMTTLLSGITKSGFTKLIGKPIYKFLTMRNFNTMKKLELLATND